MDDIVERLDEHLRFNGKDQLSRDAKGKIEELEKKIEELEGELSFANDQIDDLGDDVAHLCNTVNELEEKAINDKNKTESDHIKMLEKFMLDNGYILGNGKTMGG